MFFLFNVFEVSSIILFLMYLISFNLCKFGIIIIKVKLIKLFKLHPIHMIFTKSCGSVSLFCGSSGYRKLAFNIDLELLPFYDFNFLKIYSVENTQKSS